MRITDKQFDEIYALFEKSFPLSEYRDYAKQKELLNSPFYHIYIKLNEQDQVIGCIAYWEFEAFCFFEHFAVSPDLRGQGIGKIILEECCKMFHKPIILEVEDSSEEIAQRRIKFYERNGFVLNPFGYYQPPFHKDQEVILLRWMSYQAEVSKSQFDAYRSKLMNSVYKVI